MPAELPSASADICAAPMQPPGASTTPQPTDEALYTQFLQGDEAALEQLVARYHETLTLFLYGYVKDKAEAEQLMIDAFARLVVSAGQFGRKSSLKTYLFAIGRNEALRYLKKNPPTVSLEQLSQAARADALQQDTALQQEEKQQLYAAMSTLPLAYRQVLFLLYFERVSYQEAAQIMGKSQKQIANLTHRAKKALKKTLEQGGFQYDG